MFAGCVDAIVGGGGLILVPALFGVFPNAPPATLLGTNKATGIWGTGWSALQFSRRVQLPMRALLPAAAVALLGSFAGAWTLTLVSAEGLRKALPIILVAVLAYTLLRKDLGLTHAPSRSGPVQAAIACAIGGVVGFYDGFFGPGASPSGLIRATGPAPAADDPDWTVPPSESFPCPSTRNCAR